VLLGGIMIAFFLLNALILDANLPAERKSVIYSPYLTAIVALGIVHLPVRDRIHQFIMAGICLLLLMHFTRAYNAYSFREWYYDADTRTVVDYVSKHLEEDNDNYDLATEWLFTPSAMFYVQLEYPDVSLAPYNKAIDKDAGATFYYVQPEHVPTLEPEYKEIQNMHGRILLQRVE
jgi:hypothetical protein